MSVIESLESAFSREVEWIESHLGEMLSELPPTPGPGFKKLKESVAYSLMSGGKRFRPVLSLLTAEALLLPKARALPWGCALEMIHTYSLIHDDLPLMDNDDFRRGQPTNHKVFGEAMALLAGDALLTEAFYWIAKNYASEPALLSSLTLMMAQSAGLRGMVAGQALDIEPHPQLEPESVERLHRLKTGADLARLKADRAELGTVFCRRCDYCMPCPNDIEASYIVRSGLIFKRVGWDKLAQSHIDAFTKGLDCVRCGTCASRCPYELPLTDLVIDESKVMLRKAVELGKLTEEELLEKLKAAEQKPRPQSSEEYQ